jgi:prepilin-type N-terminal cleavage/methylation domain-containing protein
MSARRSNTRAAQRGVTLVELVLSATVLAVVVGAAALFFAPRANAQQIDSTVRDAQHIRDAALEWRRDNPVGCPTLSQLEHEGALDSNATVDDPWGGRFRVLCDGDDIVTASAGPDGKLGNHDDVRVPRPRG